jgi:hypothetical protein
MLAVTLDETRRISLNNPSRDCLLRSEQTAINSDGSVALCCTVFDLEHTIAPSFLDVDHRELQKRKYEHPLCGECMENGLHDTFVYRDEHEWTAAASRRIAPQRVPPHIRSKPKSKSLLTKISRRIKRHLHP